MKVAEFYPNPEQTEKLALKIAVLSSEAFIENPDEPPENENSGVPTESFAVAAGKVVFFNINLKRKKK